MPTDNIIWLFHFNVTKTILSRWQRFNTV